MRGGDERDTIRSDRAGPHVATPRSLRSSCAVVPKLSIAKPGSSASGVLSLSLMHLGERVRELFEACPGTGQFPKLWKDGVLCLLRRTHPGTGPLCCWMRSGRSVGIQTAEHACRIGTMEFGIGSRFYRFRAEGGPARAPFVGSPKNSYLRRQTQRAAQCIMRRTLLPETPTFRYSFNVQM
ncbi:hypothetical protein ACJJTC_012881 [Scirpophaga incertulas]